MTTTNAATATVRLPMTRGRQARVVPGVLCPAAQEAYHNGQCLALALALAAATGWPLVVHLTDRHHDHDNAAEWEAERADPAWLADDAWFHDFAHALVRTPDGDLLDIDGLHDPDGYADAARDVHGTCALVDVPPADASRASALGALPPQDHRTASVFAQAVLAAL